MHVLGRHYFDKSKYLKQGTVFIRIVATATINFSLAWVRLLIEGGFINFGPILDAVIHKICRAATISFAELQVRLLFEGGYYLRCGFYSNI